MITSILLAAAQTLSTAPLDFDLRALANERSCSAVGGDTIVVCGKQSMSDAQRLPAEPERYVEKPLVAEAALPNGWKVNLHSDALRLPGATSNRAMVTLKVPF